MANITLRAAKGSPLTHNEVDANFNNLNTDKLDTAGIAQDQRLQWNVAGSTTIRADIRGTSSNALVFGNRVGGVLTDTMILDGSGRLGIGTSSPVSQLHVIGGGLFASSTTGGTIIQARNSDLSSLGYFGVEGSTGGVTLTGTLANSTYIASGATNTALQFGTGGVIRSTLTSTGLGIGTSAPGSKLEIRNDVSATSSLDATAVKLYNNLDGGSGIEFANAVNGKSKISFGVESSGVGTDDTYIGFSTSINAGALTERARLDGAGRLLLGTSSDAGGALLQVNGNRIRVGTAKTPASATDTGTAGEICWDANYIYVCTATNTWKRTAIATW